MQLHLKDIKKIQNALHDWVKKGLIEATKAKELQKTIDWKKLNQYSFIGAIASISIYLVTALTDEAFLNFLKALFKAPARVKCLGLSIISTLAYWTGFKKRALYPRNIFSN